MSRMTNKARSRFEAPARLAAFVQEAMQPLHREGSGPRILECVDGIVDSDRWNSFDRFAQTTCTLVRCLREAGAETDVHCIQTGGEIGNGAWRIRHAADIRSATVDVIAPVKRRLVNYRDNPWQIVQWTGGTPANGLRCELVVVDSFADLARQPASALRGRMVLTQLSPYHHARDFHERGVAGILVDRPVKHLPGAVNWMKFGWGGASLEDAAADLVGCVVSADTGRELRAMLSGGRTVIVEAKVDIRRYVGRHEVVSGILRGDADPQGEVWAVAHSAEPGAADNASGVAVCIEALRVLQQMIARGRLPRPRRSIRAVFGYECYGLFPYLVEVKRFQRPLAGICVDTVGVRPEVCEGDIKVHASVPSSAGFVNDVVEAMVRGALEFDRAGYQCNPQPFISTADTLVGDPKYGFPCPFVGTHPFRGYHSSADTPAILSPAGLVTCTAAVAGYLYYLANADSRDVTELADWHTSRAVNRAHTLGATGARVRGNAELIGHGHALSMQHVQRWLWGGDRRVLLETLAASEHVFATAVRAKCEGARSRVRLDGISRTVADSIPRRRIPLAPTVENMWPHTAVRFTKTAMPAWALYWADGERSLRDITRLLTAELERGIRLKQVAAYFELLRELGWVDLVPSTAILTRQQLLADLRNLGVASGMDLMVHSSLSHIGHVRGGAETVIEALLAAVGKRGTLMMPSFNHKSAAVFNPMTTPTANGAIPDAFWRRAEAVRSLHPTHAVAAIGPKAAQWCEGHLENGIWAPDSPIGRLVHHGGYILGLGVDHTSSTAYHVAEMSMPCGCLDPFGGRDRIVDAEGRVRDVPGLAWRDGICPVSPCLLSPALDARKQQRRGTVGHADCVLVKAIDLWNMRREQLRNACPRCPIKPRTC